jgi:hypothetical protein
MENPYRRRAAEIRRSIATASTPERVERLREVARIYEVSAVGADRVSEAGPQEQPRGRRRRIGGDPRRS